MHDSVHAMEDSVLLAPALFIASLLSFTLPIGYKSKVANEYNTTLESLFRVAVQPTRHNISDNDLFVIRKSFFQRLYDSCTNLKNTKVIHVAGTKGKGSNVEYISSAIKHCGYKVGVFTSPHLHTARERIRINSSLISKSDVNRLGKIALSNMKNETWTVFFDLILYMAILYFNENSVDYIVLETGIGGRYDSTNFIDNPIACVITSISLDHTSILGNTLTAISRQKVGIVKNNSHLFTLKSQNEEVLDVFREECRALDAHIYEVNINYDKIKSLDLELSYTTQQENISLSIAVLEYLNIPLHGLRHTFWPCRYEKFNINKTILYIDGCHNGDSVEKFLRNLKKIYHSKRIIVLFGAGSEKCVDDMLLPVTSYCDELLFIQSKHFKSLAETELYQLLGVGFDKSKLVLKSPSDYKERELQGTINHRVDLVLQRRGNDANCVIAICGSLFVAAESREYLYSVYPNLFHEEDWVRYSDL